MCTVTYTISGSDCAKLGEGCNDLWVAQEPALGLKAFPFLQGMDQNGTWQLLWVEWIRLRGNQATHNLRTFEANMMAHPSEIINSHNSNSCSGSQIYAKPKSRRHPSIHGRRWQTPGHDVEAYVYLPAQWQGSYNRPESVCLQSLHTHTPAAATHGHQTDFKFCQEKINTIKEWVRSNQNM